MTSLAGKIAMVTGAANGIGRSCACLLADDGADLVLIDLDKGGLDVLAAALDRQDCNALTIAGRLPR